MFTLRRTVFVSALLAAGLSFGCTSWPGQGVQFLSVNLENGNPRVGEATTLRLEVLAGWFQDPVFYYRAQRGRIVGMNGEQGPQGGYVRATNQVRYYAPYTSQYLSTSGLRNDDTIEIMAQQGTNVTRTTKVVSVSGSTVVFATQPTGSAPLQQSTSGGYSNVPQQGNQNGTIMIATDSGGQQQTTPVPLTDLSGHTIMGSSPVISPTGDKIAYVYYPGDGTSKIMMRDASGQVLSLTNNSSGVNVDPAWSPDGNYLLFAGTQDTHDGTYEIYMENVDSVDGGGRAVTRLTNNNWSERHPSWNPVATSTSLGFTGTGAAGPGVIACAAKKNNLQSPGGNGQNWNIFLLDAHGTYVREVSDLQGDGDNWAGEPNWRADGNAIAYTRYGPVNNFQSASAKFQRIYVQDLTQSTTQTPLNVANTDTNSAESSPIWSTSQSGQIYFLRTDASYGQYAHVYNTQYLPGGGGNQYPPQMIGTFQSLNLPLTTMGQTNQQFSGFHPFDWR